MAAVLAPELDTASSVLEFARAQRTAADLAERNLMLAAVDWAAMHSVDSLDDAAGHWVPGADVAVPIAGEGAPWIGEFCVAEFAAAINLPTEHGKAYLGEALELRHRLPRVWRRVVDGDLLAWRARRVAEATMTLSLQAAAYVDRYVAHTAHKIGPTALARLVEEAISRFDPETAEAESQRGRHVTICPPQGTRGTSDVLACLDVADAKALEAAIRAIARDLKLAGSTESLDVRRSMALGILARGDQAGTQVTDAGKSVVLNVRLDPDSGVAHLDQVPVMVEQVKDWCAGGKVSVRPVIDLNDHLATDHYEPTPRLREQTVLRDPVCVFPHCTRPSRGLDLDHVIAWADGGPTAPDNLAPLCRRHHRLKTHGHWTYAVITPGHYNWESPHGQRFTTSGITTERAPDRPAPRP